MGFGAKSRSNTIDHQQFGKQKKLFSGPADNNDNLLKTSDLLGASILFKKFSPYATMKCGIYGDIDNKFLFSQVTLDLSKLISISNSYSLSLVAKFSEVSGYNIFKNDLLNRHSRIWVDDRTKNYLKARADLAFLKFPILSNFNLIPRLYFESWATFGKIAGKLTTNWEGELGINIFRSENIWIDFALLQMSRKRREGYAPTIRF